MRLLMTTDAIGGVWNYTCDLVESLLQRDCAVALASFGRLPSPAQREWTDAVGLRFGAKFRYISSDAPLEWMESNHYAYDQSSQLLAGLAREFGAELLHSNQYCFGRLPLAIPKLIVAHNDVLSWGRMCGRRPQPLAWIDRYYSLVSDGLAGADAVVAPTAWMLRALAESFALPPNSLVIPNGRALAPAPPSAAHVLQAVSAGRLGDPGKNLELLAGVEAPFPLLIAGRMNSTNPEDKLENYGDAKLVGWLEPEDLFTLFRSSAIYICPSRYEPFGLAPLEAGLCGCAVVANDILSLREIWEGAALFFHDAPSLSKLLARLAANPRDLLLARRRSQQRAQEFTAARMAEEYLALYGRLAAARQSAARAA